MKRVVTLLAILAVASLAFAQNDVRISQVYGGGGSSQAAATFNRDFVELFNAGSAPVDISGWALEYGSATGNWGSSSSNIFVFPEGTVLPACAYLMVACGNVGTGGAELPYFDFEALINAAAANGKFALFTEPNVNVPCGSEIPGTVVDIVGYGTATCFEGSGAAPATAVDTAAFRKQGGMIDTDDNAADFELGTPAPRYSGSPLHVDCASVSTEAIDWSTLRGNYR
jgi:uncharacterized protein